MSRRAAWSGAGQRFADDASTGAGATGEGTGLAALQMRANENAHAVQTAQLREALRGSPAVLRIAGTQAMLDQRGHAPAQRQADGAAGTGIVQRKINYATASKPLGLVRNRAELLAAAARLFPRLQGVEALVDEIENLRPTWTLADVYRALKTRNDEIPMPIGEGERDETIMMPSKEADRQHFGFTTRTRARGRVNRRDRSPVPLRDATQGKGLHAEDGLMQQLNALLKSRSIGPGDTIYITINNSPCLGRCAPNLARWYQQNGRGIGMVVQYANPYGEVEEFIEARQMMRAAGITVKSFPAERYVDDNELSVRQRQDFGGMKKRRKEYRERWNQAHPSDASSDSDASDSSSDSGTVSDSDTVTDDEMGRDFATSNDATGNRAPASEILHVEVDDQAFKFDPDEIGNEGDCFYETLVAMGAAGGRDVAGLRALAVQNGARAQAGTAGEWADEGDITAVAQGLGVQIVVVVLDLGYEVEEVRGIGEGGAVYVAHIFRGHFVPLRPA